MKFVRILQGLTPILALVILNMSACQHKKTGNNTLPESDFLALTKMTNVVGDSVTVRLSQALTRVTVGWDNSPVTGAIVADKTISFRPTIKTVGLHQLVVSGQTGAQQTISDTLTVELWSDVKPEHLNYTVLQTYPHQNNSFTQGLEFYQNTLYEGTGLNGQSRLMKVDLTSGAIKQSVALPEHYFGEGITVVNDRIYQLTWTSGQCFQYNLGLDLQKTFHYDTQGWGMTHLDSTLVVSDGSNRLSYYSPSFRKTGEILVYDDQGPVMNLNELEHINGYVLANVWQTNRIVQIDMASGKVVGELLIDAKLVAGVDTKENVLNGIAYQPGEQAIYITGKHWPALFKLQVKQLFKSAPRQRLVL